MGRPKGLVELGGRALVEHPIEALRAAGLETVVVAKPETLMPPLDVPVWIEPAMPTHPLLGILTALGRGGGRSVLVCACDMPFVTPRLVELIARLDGQTAIPEAGGLLHPLLGRYDFSDTDALTDALAAQRPLQEAVARLDPTVIPEHELRVLGDPERLLFNVNTPADLERAKGLSQ
jgi:molybdopterin-guanine dinucleotide biosynthesis protein A